MKAVLFKNGLRLVDDYPKPSLKQGEALVRVSMAGICGTDLEIIKGYRSFEGVIGHELCGVVEAVQAKTPAGNRPEGSPVPVGTRVVAEINCGCGWCEYCRHGIKNHCSQRTVIGIADREGCMGEYVAVPLENLHPVPDEVTDEEAVFAELLAAAFEITEQVCLKPSDRVAVLGDGRLGILSALVLNLTCADVKLLGKHSQKLAVASDQKVKTILLENLFGQKEAYEKKYDLVVEATGSLDGFELACTLVRPRGKIVLKSTTAGKAELSLTPLVVDEITVVGSRCGPFAPALRALEEKAIDVRPLISGSYKFEQALKAFELCKSGDHLKVLIDFRQYCPGNSPA